MDQVKVAVANAVPVAADAIWPPAEATVGGRIVVPSDTPLETKGDDGPHNLLALVGDPSIVHPVVADGKRVGELGNVKETASVLVAAGLAKRRILQLIHSAILVVVPYGPTQC